MKCSNCKNKVRQPFDLCDNCMQKEIIKGKTQLIKYKK